MFRTLSKHGEFEIRFYERMLSARISISGSFHEMRRNGIRELKNYLSGHNFKALEISKYGPFYQEYKSNAWEVGVILPPEFDMENVPKPIGHIIQLKETLPKRCGVLKIRGSITPELIFDKAALLKRWIWRNRLKIAGPLNVLEHDTSQGISFFKHSEVIFDVD